MQRLAVLGKPPPSCPRQGNAPFHTMGKEKQQETKRNINMKYAQLPLCTRERRMDLAGLPGSLCWGTESSGVQQGQREGSGGHRGTLPISGL